MNCPVCEVFKQVVDAGQQDPFLVHKRLLAELPTVFNSLAKADLFPRFLDGLLGAQKLLHDANVPEEFARAALKSAIKAFTDFVTEKETTDEGKQFVAGAAEQLSSIPASQMVSSRSVWSFIVFRATLSTSTSKWRSRQSSRRPSGALL